MPRRNSFDEASAGFRAHLPDLSSPRFTSAANQNIYEYSKCMQDNRAPPWLYDLTKVWEKLLEEPYKGVTNDGTVRDGLYEAQDEEFDIGNAVSKAETLLNELTEEQREKVSYPINAREWRAWSNPEFLLRPFGLRLEEGKPPYIQQSINPTNPTQSPNKTPNPSSPSSKLPSRLKAIKKPSQPCESITS